MEINEEHCKYFGNGRNVMKLWIITLQFQLKKQNRYGFINSIFQNKFLR